MEFSAGGVVYARFDDIFKFVLIRDHNDQWTFPKGHIEKNEKPEMAALRETEEEIGLNNIKIVQMLDKLDYWFRFNDESIHKYVYFYLMENLGDSKLTPQLEEIHGAEWFTPEKAMEAVGYKAQNQPILAKAFQILNIPCDQAQEDLK